MCKLVDIFTICLNHFTTYKIKHFGEEKSLYDKEQEERKALELHTNTARFLKLPH